MRTIARLLFADPSLLFSGLALAAVALAIVAFIWSERRARKLAELSDDPSLAAGQLRRLAIVAIVTATIIGAAAWWSFYRVHTEPQRVLIAIAVETEAGPLQWWQDSSGAAKLADALGERLDAVGLEVVEFDADVSEVLDAVEAGEPESLLAAARKLEARWLIRGRVRPDKTIALELAAFSDYVMTVELELVDAETGEVAAIPDAPLRVFLWGEDPDDAVALNARYLADRLTMPVIATLGGQPPLREYAGDRTGMTADEAVLATALERLFSRSDSYAKGLELRAADEAEARAREPKNHAQIAQTRLSAPLAEEFFIGTAADGRVLLLTDPKHVSVVPDELGYSLTSEGEALVLADADGQARELLFEHYNFYSAPAISADGRVVWTTVANHGASKSLATIDVATGEFRPVLSHPTDYYTSPIPAPDGARALFFSRPGRYAETAIEVIGRDGSGRAVLLAAQDEPRLPDWAPDGRTVYVPVGSWQRIVAIDVESGARRHVLGQDPAAPIEPGDPIAPSERTPDPRHPSDPRLPPLPGHVNPAPAEQPDPRTTSRFTEVSVGHDGRTLYVVEQSLDGREWLGRFDLEIAAAPGPDQPSPYARLAQIEIGRVLASPTGPLVAFEAPSFTATGDPETRDQEILVFGPEPGQLRALTLNSVDDELAGWSRDGRSVFTIQRQRDPGSDNHPVARVYRHAL